MIDIGKFCQFCWFFSCKCFVVLMDKATLVLKWLYLLIRGLWVWWTALGLILLSFGMIFVVHRTFTIYRGRFKTLLLICCCQDIASRGTWRSLLSMIILIWSIILTFVLLLGVRYKSPVSARRRRVNRTTSIGFLSILTTTLLSLVTTCCVIVI